MKFRQLAGRIGFYGLVALILFYAVFPFYWAVISSLKSGSAIFHVELIPSAATLENYRALFIEQPFARNILNGQDIIMLSDGLAKRTYCYTADAVSGYFKVLVKGRDGEAYNVGVEHPEISVIELAERAIALGRELFGYKGKVVRSVSADKEYLVDNPNRRCPIITKARTELGYDPRVIVDEGLKRSLLWYSGNREASEA